jgi:hypothetical protein
MKKILVGIIIAVAFLSPAARANIVVHWNIDALQQFDVTISGSGLADFGSGYGGFAGSLTSPSGLWSMTTQNTFKPRDDFRPGWLEIHNGATMTYNGAVPPGNPHTFIHTQPYADLLPAVAPVQDGAIWQQDYGAAHPEWYRGGGSTITITSIPNPTDPTTWIFTTHYYASVPEPGIVSFGALAVGLVALRARRRR